MRHELPVMHCAPIQGNGLEYKRISQDLLPGLHSQGDKRYRTKYHMSMIENLESIKEQGMEQFLIQEEENKEKKK